MSYKTLSLVATLALFTTGCSTIAGSGTSQSISVQTYTADGQDLEGVRCDMSNDEGSWFVVTPGTATVHRSNKDLQVICKKPDIEPGAAKVVSRTKGTMFGNIIFGGGVGAIIDHNNGSAYEYPALIKILMGKLDQKIDAKTAAAQAAKPAAAIPTETAPATAQPSTSSPNGDSPSATPDASK